MSNRIRELRLEKNLTQTELGKIINVSQRSVGFYETGDRDPDTDTLKQLADFFNVSIDYLLGRNNKTFDELTDDISEDLIFLGIDPEESKREHKAMRTINPYKNLTEDEIDKMEEYKRFLFLQRSKEESAAEEMSAMGK